MSFYLPRRIEYSRLETMSDLLVHIAGLTAALLAVPLLIMRTLSTDTTDFGLVGASVYGLTLIAMILCSMLYNMTHPQTWTPYLQRLDHSAIYLKIAGTYTAFALLSPHETGWFLVWIWSCAALGVGLRTFVPNRWRSVAISLYLIMGWSGVIAGDALFGGMSSLVFGLILGGGLIYTVGFGFFVATRLPFHRTIWHLLVIVASGLFYSAVATQIGTLS
ncbi:MULTISPECIES: hemolysin III family protein [unclassified Paracoccus (in: a-proteobacteria)]|uniref:PAQR family membrane homeostasis protein TrhA n=1 Tax=unclassified Paracoccus (in: a-proteobacteria) TaxID=2688777 RepID=UPI0006974865|nr:MULTISPECIES: hemolysin III family protein [unclassified Paracoccus (in: a-proteobacteria)]